MSEPIIPAGAFAAMKAGMAQPSQSSQPAPAAQPAGKPESAPKTITRKAPQPQPAADVKENGPPADATPAEKKIWKLKADGEEFEFDASDEEAIKREIMKARGANKRFQSAAELKKQAETFFNMMKDPQQLRKVLEDPRVGVDVKKFAQEYLWEKIQDEQLTPEQREQREKDRELEEYRQQKAKQEQERVEREKAERVSRMEQSYEQKITKALEMGGIPKTHATVARMADYLEKALNYNLDLSPEELVQHVRNDYLSDFSSVLSAADGEQLLALIGEANAEKLRQADLKRLKSTQSNPFQARSRPKDESLVSQQQKKLPASEWKEDLIKGFLARK